MKQKYGLVGVDGNAFAIMSYVCNAMKAEGMTCTEEYLRDAKSSTYEHLICVSVSYLDKANKIAEKKKQTK